MNKKENQGYTIKKVIKRNNSEIRVYSPILTDEERARRIARIRKAAGAFLATINF